MTNFRRWYFYIVAAVSLQAVSWAAITLLRNLLLSGDLSNDRIQRIAFQIAVILIGLPLFLFHWRRAQRPTAIDPGSQHSRLDRSLYLVLMLSAFLIPFVTNARNFLTTLLRRGASLPQVRSLFADRLDDSGAALFSGIALIILGVMIAYHASLLRDERSSYNADPISERLFTVFIYGFSALGLMMTAVAAINLLRILLDPTIIASGLTLPGPVIAAIAALLVGLPLWLYFWRLAQRQQRGAESESDSRLRYVYLYSVIFLSVLGTVAALTSLLNALFRRLLDLEQLSGGGTIPSLLLVAGGIWVYHALVLREDTAVLPALNEQAGVQRLYRYLVAGIGLLALLFGLGGVLGVLFDPVPAVINRQGTDLSWFAATMIAGLLVWIIPWRRIEQETAEPAPQGTLARTSFVRRFYLYFFLLLATLTFLISAVFILSRLLTLLLGQPLEPSDLRDTGLSAAYLLMATAVWLFHGRLLRDDNLAVAAQLRQRLAALQIVVVDDGDGSLGAHLLDSLGAALPGAQIAGVGLTNTAAATMHLSEEQDNEEVVAAADLIIGPWSVAALGNGSAVPDSLYSAIAASPARRTILPKPSPGWSWLGIPPWDEEKVVLEATQSIADSLSGDLQAAARPLTPGVIILLIIATLLILALLASLLGSVLPLFG